MRTIGHRGQGDRPRAAPHVRVRRLAVLVLLSMVGVVVALLVDGQVEAASDAAVARDRSAIEAVSLVERELVRSQAALIEATTLDGTERAAALQEYQRARTESADRWERFLEVVPTSEETAALQGRYEAARRSWSVPADTLAAGVGTAGLSDAAVQRYLTESDESLAVALATLYQLEDEQLRPALAERQVAAQQRGSRARVLLLAGLSAVGLLVAAVARSLYRDVATQWREIHERDHERARAAASAALDRRIGDALAMSESEPQVLATVGKILEQEFDDSSAQLLLADDSMAHLHARTATVEPEHPGSCAVSSPAGCPAIRRGTTLEFPDSTDYDVCPNLRDRGGPRASATCVPLAIGGRATGVLHVVTPTTDTTPHAELTDVERVANKTADRLTSLRTFEQTRRRAETDPLTGLVNRRVLETQLDSLVTAAAPMSVVFADLDHFKRLNDVHGHATGDRALRVFAEVLRGSLRPDDTACRWGGEEFVLALPGATAVQAEHVVSRIRTALRKRLETADVPSLTASFGIAEHAGGESPEDLLARADEALLLAKQQGRDRALVAPAARSGGVRRRDEGPGHRSVPPPPAPAGDQLAIAHGPSPRPTVTATGRDETQVAATLD